MHLYDPRREVGPGNRPYYAGGSTILPHFSVWPLQDGTFQVMAWVPSEWNSFGPRYTVWKLEDLPGLLQAYAEDPEGVLQKYFQFDPEKVWIKPQPKEGLTTKGVTAFKQAPKPYKTSILSDPALANLSLEDLLP